MPKKLAQETLSQDKPANKGVADKKLKGSKKNTSLRLEKQTLKALKILAIEKETSVQRLIEGLIDEYLAKEQKKKK